MLTPVKAIPDGRAPLTPYLTVRDAPRAIEFYRRAFAAVPGLRMDDPDGRVMHAELRIGGALIMLAEENPGMGNRGPLQLGGSPVGLLLYVEDVDAAIARAVDAGATIKREVKDQFYGDRTGCVEDPFGHTWHLATHIEDVSEAEMRTRLAALMQQAAHAQQQTIHARQQAVHAQQQQQQ